MANRLILTVEDNEKELAKIYYHWGAENYSSFEITRDIAYSMFDPKWVSSYKDPVLRLIRIVEDYGGCIDNDDKSKERKKVEKLYPNESFKTDGSRNLGLIAITREGMDYLESYSQGDCYINIDTKTFENLAIFNTDEHPKDYIKTELSLCEGPIDTLDEILELAGKYTFVKSLSDESIIEF